MGIECPNGHGRQPVVKNITANLDIPKKASDVIAVQLKCGCRVGGEQYQAYAAQVKAIEAEEARSIAEVRKKYAGKKAANLKTYLSETEE